MGFYGGGTKGPLFTLADLAFAAVANRGGTKGEEKRDYASDTFRVIR